MSTEEQTGSQTAEEDVHPLERGLDTYPVRESSQDPAWAVRTVWTWVGIMIFLLLFILYLLIAGLWYD